MRYRVISIGALGRNRFWDEGQAKRFSHATTTLIEDEEALVLVDPSLPPEVLVQRLDERAGLSPDRIDKVFLTTFRPVHRRSLSLFERADWLMHGLEIEAMREHLEEMAGRGDGERDEGEVEEMVGQERSLLERIRAAEDKLTRAVHLFPLAGASVGSAGLLLAMPMRTVVVTGDAVVTQDHFEAGRVFEGAWRVDQAQASLSEVVEIADEIVPGHDNAFRVVGR